MKVRFNRHEMAEALASICAVAATRTPKPILQCTRVEAHEDHLLLTATDLELGVRCLVNQVEVGETGETLVAADTLARIVRESTDELLSFETAENHLHVRGADSHFQIVTQDPGDFPLVPEIDGQADFTGEFGEIHRAIEWTIFAAARENTRYAINGVLWHLEGSELTLAATDGRRLSRATASVNRGEDNADWQTIVPVKAMGLLSKVSIDADSLVGIKMVGSQVLFQAGPLTLSSAVVEGRFPNYKDVIPTDCDREVELNRAEFQSALRRAALLTNEESKGVRLLFEDGKLTLSSRAPEQGEATISLAVALEGEKIEIGFNPVFLLDVLRVTQADSIVFGLKDQNRPGVVHVGSQLLHVVMPVNLS